MITSRQDITSSSNGKIKKETTIIHNILHGVVISNVDEKGMSRLKIRVRGVDDKHNISNNELPYCYPLLPKFFHLIPKVNEIVKVLISDIERPYSLRYWMGPVISQPQFYSFEDGITAENGTEYELSESSISPNKFENSKGIYPELEDVAILGRENNDIILKDKEVTLRVGKHIFNDKIKINKKNPGYINLKVSNDGNLTTIMNVANKIGIMTHNGKKTYKSILDEEEITKFFDTAHPLLKGDLTVEVLKKIINAILFHVHGGSGSPAVPTNPIIELSKLNLDNIISENIRIN